MHVFSSDRAIAFETLYTGISVHDSHFVSSENYIALNSFFSYGLFSTEIRYLKQPPNFGLHTPPVTIAMLSPE